LRSYDGVSLPGPGGAAKTLPPESFVNGVLFLQSQTFFGTDSAMQANIARHLDRSRWQVHVAVDPSRSTDSELDAYHNLATIPDVHTVPARFGPLKPAVTPAGLITAASDTAGSLARFLAVAGYVKRRRIDVIHASEKPRDAVGAVLLGKVTRARSVVHLHAKWDRGLAPATRWALRNADRVIGVSAFVKQSAVADGGIAGDRACHVLNGIDPDVWQPRRAPSAVRHEFGIDEATVLIGIASRTFDPTAHPALIRALALTTRAHADVKLLMMGSDGARAAPGHPPLGETLRKLARDLAIEERVIFAGRRTDMPAVMAALDIYAMPTVEEALGTSYLEAMAMQKPVVALASGGVPEIVTDGENGFLVPPGDVEALAQRLSHLVQDQALRAAMGARGRRRIVGALNARRMAADAERVYMDLVSSRSLQRPGFGWARDA
jgi:glycosyltransferase involved in cell wall biosynthesis